MSPEKTDPRNPKPQAESPWWNAAIGWLIIGSIIVLVWSVLSAPRGKELSFTELQDHVAAKEVRSLTLDPSGDAHGELTDGTEFHSRVPAALDARAFTEDLRAAKVEVNGAPAKGMGVLGTLLGLLPFLFLIGLVFWIFRSGRSAVGGLGGMTGFGRSKAKIIDAERPNTTFDDIAGYDGVKEEVGEVVDFLRDPTKFAAAGAKGPRGVIMVGPPGTGKTLFAKAVAGQAAVPFLSVTGSAFVEMFVGVGASRVRDLFAEARERAPSIIFIDEIDAIGGRRGVRMQGGNDEREQTLNQLLAEMDGFDSSSGVVVLAATNRPEVLDAALLRPGRFDRQVVVPLPSMVERSAILAVHARSKHLGPDVDLDLIARATPGFSGADLANLLNEAAIHAVRDNRSTVEAHDVDAARDRILLGRRDSSNALLADERESVSVHEAGHALIAELCDHADPVAKVTILPAGRALGVTEQLPAAERRLYTEDHLRDLLAVRMGGRAAELVVFGVASTGASDDLAGATQIATRMVCEFGLSTALGPVGYLRDASEYIPGIPDRPPWAEATQRVVDEEVARLLREAEARAISLLRTHRSALDRLARLLREVETVDGSEVEHVLATTDPVAAPTAPQTARGAAVVPKDGGRPVPQGEAFGPDPAVPNTGA